MANDQAAPSPDLPLIEGFHAHVYFGNDDERRRALALREAIATAHPAAVLGRVHDRPVFVHPAPMYQVAFEPEAFGDLVPWLMLRRKGLSILVHAVTGDVVAEHRDWPLWLGEPLALALERLESDRSDGSQD